MRACHDDRPAFPLPLLWRGFSCLVRDCGGDLGGRRGAGGFGLYQLDHLEDELHLCSSYAMRKSYKRLDEALAFHRTLGIDAQAEQSRFTNYRRIVEQLLQVITQR